MCQTVLVMGFFFYSMYKLPFAGLIRSRTNLTWKAGNFSDCAIGVWRPVGAVITRCVVMLSKVYDASLEPDMEEA